MEDEAAEPTERVLALEIRPTVIGFALFDVFGGFLDWGRRTHRVARENAPQVAADRMATLIEQHQPSVIITRRRNIRTAHLRQRINAIVQTVRREARIRRIEFLTVQSEAIRRFFASQHCTSKDERAALIARWFPDLSWKLPRKRKPWNSEDQRMVLFDAAATALSFLNRAKSGKEIALR